jgi:nucleoside-diphosphate-sugar epimerase
VSRTALVIGGTGPTGPSILQGLLDRGFDVTIFHRGHHEPPDLPEVRHIHGDPHFRESIDEAVGGQSFDVVVAAYGRTGLLAEAFAGRTGHFLSIGGSPRYAGFNEPHRVFPSGPAQPLREDSPLVTLLDAEDSPGIKFAQKIVRTEEQVFAAQPDATHLVYPIAYGPRNVWPWEWSVVKRALDGRRRVVITDEGLALHTRGAARNLAEFTLLAVDRPEASRGQIYNCGDDVQYNVRQWVELAAEAVGVEFEVLSLPSRIAPWLQGIFVPHPMTIVKQAVLDTSKARNELGYRDVVTPAQALADSVAWYRENPDHAATSPAFVDRFDYELEDKLIETYQRFAEEVGLSMGVDMPDEVHPMAHPKKLGDDHRGR